MRMTLLEFGFPSIVVNFIMSHITFSSLSLKRNGEKLDNFKPKRGLRQEDPLSPYLFVFCLEKKLIPYDSKSCY